MQRLRFHIGTLGIVIVAIGIGMAALRESNDLWDSCVFSFTIAALLAAVVLAIHRTGKKRAFWLGFALFGAAYLGLSLVPSIEARLITTRLLAYVDSKISRSNSFGIVYADFDNDGAVDLYVANGSHPKPLAQNNNGGWIADVTPGALPATKGYRSGSYDYLIFSNASPSWPGTTANFVHIGHSVFAMLAALIGGLWSRRLRDAAESRVPMPESDFPQGNG
jgi:hypothetical protein